MKLLTPFKNTFGEIQTEIKIPAVLTVGDILWMRREAGSDPYMQAVKLLQRVSGLDDRDMEKLDVRDFDSANAKLLELQEIPKSQPSSDGSKTS